MGTNVTNEGGISRRSFLRVMGLSFGAAMLTACNTGTADSPADSPAASVPDADTPVPFLTEDEFPRLDGSTACIPLMAQMKADVTGMDLLEAQTGITVSTTAYAWENFGLWSRSDSEDYGTAAHRLRGPRVRQGRAGRGRRKA